VGFVEIYFEIKGVHTVWGATSARGLGCFDCSWGTSVRWVSDTDYDVAGA
jgi:hypothetical protein